MAARRIAPFSSRWVVDPALLGLEFRLVNSGLYMVGPGLGLLPSLGLAAGGGLALSWLWTPCKF